MKAWKINIVRIPLNEASWLASPRSTPPTRHALPQCGSWATVHLPAARGRVRGCAVHRGRLAAGPAPRGDTGGRPLVSFWSCGCEPAARNDTAVPADARDRIRRLLVCWRYGCSTAASARDRDSMSSSRPSAGGHRARPCCSCLTRPRRRCFVACSAGAWCTTTTSAAASQRAGRGQVAPTVIVAWPGSRRARAHVRDYMSSGGLERHLLPRLDLEPVGLQERSSTDHQLERTPTAYGAGLHGRLATLP